MVGGELIPTQAAATQDPHRTSISFGPMTIVIIVSINSLSVNYYILHFYWHLSIILVIQVQQQQLPQQPVHKYILTWHSLLPAFLLTATDDARPLPLGMRLWVVWCGVVWLEKSSDGAELPHSRMSLGKSIWGHGNRLGRRDFLVSEKFIILNIPTSILPIYYIYTPFELLLFEFWLFPVTNLLICIFLQLLLVPNSSDGVENTFC